MGLNNTAIKSYILDQDPVTMTQALSLATKKLGSLSIVHRSAKGGGSKPIGSSARAAGLFAMTEDEEVPTDDPATAHIMAAIAAGVTACWGCGKVGHLKRDCPDGASGGGRGRPMTRGNAGPRGSASGGGQRNPGFQGGNVNRGGVNNIAPANSTPGASAGTASTQGGQAIAAASATGKKKKKGAGRRKGVNHIDGEEGTEAEANAAQGNDGMYCIQGNDASDHGYGDLDRFRL